MRAKGTRSLRSWVAVPSDGASILIVEIATPSAAERGQGTSVGARQDLV
jgi:hypothetical protein